MIGGDFSTRSRIWTRDLSSLILWAAGLYARRCGNTQLQNLSLRRRKMNSITSFTTLSLSRIFSSFTLDCSYPMKFFPYLKFKCHINIVHSRLCRTSLNFSRISSLRESILVYWYRRHVLHVRERWFYTRVIVKPHTRVRINNFAFVSKYNDSNNIFCKFLC